MTLSRKRRVSISDQTIEAIRSGGVDAFVVGEEGSEKVLVLNHTDPPWRRIVEEMAEGAVTLTDEGAVAYCNPEFARLTGEDRQEILGQPFADFVTDECSRTLQRLISGSSDNRVELELRVLDGSSIPVIAARSELPEDSSARCCIVFTDLREQRSREQLRSAKEAAELANSVKDEFLAMTSHELRTPLTAILGWTQHLLLIENPDAATVRQGVEGIQQGARNLSKLVDDILDTSRLTRGKLSLEMEVLDLREAAKTVIEWMQRDAGSQKVTINLDVASSREVRVLGDADRIQQILVNLLSNAVRFSPAGGMVNVRVEADARTARLLVKDYGDGIDPAFLPHLFEAFRQGGKETRTHRGLGLGLSIVQQLVEAHGGTVRAFSEGRGKGATFTVELPLITE